jgi:hypothetical protein
LIGVEISKRNFFYGSGALNEESRLESSPGRGNFHDSSPRQIGLYRDPIPTVFRGLIGSVDWGNIEPHDL